MSCQEKLLIQFLDTIYYKLIKIQKKTCLKITHWVVTVQIVIIVIVVTHI